MRGHHVLGQDTSHSGSHAIHCYLKISTKLSGLASYEEVLGQDKEKIKSGILPLVSTTVLGPSLYRKPSNILYVAFTNGF